MVVDTGIEVTAAGRVLRSVTCLPLSTLAHVVIIPHLVLGMVRALGTLVECHRGKVVREGSQCREGGIEGGSTCIYVKFYMCKIKKSSL